MTRHTQAPSATDPAPVSQRHRVERAAPALVLGLSVCLPWMDANACSRSVPNGLKGPDWNAIRRDLAHNGVVRITGQLEAWPMPEVRTVTFGGPCGADLYGVTITLTIDRTTRRISLDQAPPNETGGADAQPEPSNKPLPEVWSTRLWSLIDRELTDFHPVAVSPERDQALGCRGDWVAADLDGGSLLVARGWRGRSYTDAMTLAAAQKAGAVVPPDPQTEPLMPCAAFLTIGARSWTVTNLRVELTPNGERSDKR